MNKQIFNFLKKFTDVNDVNRLLISSFVTVNNLAHPINQTINSLIIRPRDDDHQGLLEFIQLLKAHDPTFGFEHLLELFEFVISPADKLVNGAVYTPANIRRYITKQAFSQCVDEDTDQLRVGDISCGCGGFLIDAAIEIKKQSKKSYYEIFRDNIFGLDIQKYSIDRTKILLTLLALSEGEDREKFEFNLYVDNALRFNWREECKQIKENDGFDILLGNPPYVCSRNMDEESKVLLPNWSVSSTGHPDLYIPFFQICHEYLKEQGILGYITVNTFFKSVNGRAIRKYFSDHAVHMRLIDFGGEQVFRSRSTYTCICFLQKAESNGIDYVQCNSKALEMLREDDFQTIPYSTLDDQQGWNLSNQDIVQKIESVGVKFDSLFKTRSGIATLKNNVYIFDPIGEDEKCFYMDENIKIEKNICRDIINPNRLIQNRSLDGLKHKIIFPYEYDAKKLPQIIDEKVLSTTYPETYKYLLSQREVLATRDKGNGNYIAWYAYGRHQSMEKMKYKLFFPHITPHSPHYILSSDEDLLFYNGMAASSDNEEDMIILKMIMESDVFWFYIESTSKNYSSGYYSLSRNYIKNFGVCQFTKEEKVYLLNEQDAQKVNRFICEKYGFERKA